MRALLRLALGAPFSFAVARLKLRNALVVVSWLPLQRSSSICIVEISEEQLVCESTLQHWPLIAFALTFRDIMCELGELE